MALAVALLALPHTAFAAAPVSLDGRVLDAADHPVAGASLACGSTSATSGPDGRFTILCPAGANLDVRRAGFQPVALVVIAAAGTQTIHLSVQTLSSIGGTTTSARVPFNTQPGAYATISHQTVLDQEQPQFSRLLDQTPGVTSNHTASSNPASPGVQTSPNLRGTLDYEKTTLIDGHPVATGRFGDYVTSFMDAYVFQSVEIAKGPGAFAPLVVNGLGGSINFRTPDPTRAPSSALDFVTDGNGGTLGHLRFSDTIGKLGFVVDTATYGTPGPLHGYQTTVVLPSGSTIAGVGTVGATTSGTPPAGTPAGTYPIVNAQNNPSNAYVRLAACCQTVDTSYLGHEELLKASYRFSDATSLTAAYLGTQARFDLDGAQLQQFGATLAGSGTPLTINPTTHLPSNVMQTENEPMFEAELRTAIGNGTLLARWYSLTLDRYTGNAAQSPSQAFTGQLALTGSAPLVGGGTTPAYNGQTATVTIPNVYSRTAEEDAVRGASLAWDHPAGPNDYGFALDRIVQLTNAYAIGAANGAATVTTSVPAGSRQTITSLLARDTLRPTVDDSVTLAAYATTYQSHVSSGPGPSGFLFTDATHAQVQPRLGYTHRFRDAVLRFAAGGAVTPPAFNVLSGVNQSPAAVYRPGATSVTVTQNASNLLPETSFGYDAGGDIRTGSPDRVLSADVYETTVRNQLVSTVTPLGTYTPPGGAAIPLYASGSANAGNARFWGIELALRSDPRVGFGYVVQGAATRAYAYDVSPAIYATSSGALTTNLAVVPGVNYTSTATGFNGISNKGIAYTQGYGELHYRTAADGLLLFGLTYYGPNNSYGLPAFTVANASVRFPLAITRTHAALEIAVDNLFNNDGGSMIVTDGGIPVALVNRNVGLVNQLPIGPRTLRFALHLGR